MLRAQRRVQHLLNPPQGGRPSHKADKYSFSYHSCYYYSCYYYYYYPLPLPLPLYYYYYYYSRTSVGRCNRFTLW